MLQIALTISTTLTAFPSLTFPFTLSSLINDTGTFFYFSRNYQQKICYLRIAMRLRSINKKLEIN
jgi:hypothetical protein